MSERINFYPAEEYEPREVEKEAIDWRARRMAQLALQGVDYPQPYRVRFGDLDVELTPKTGGAIINHTEDDLDAIWLDFNREDGAKLFLFRDQLREAYDDILQLMFNYGMVATTQEPSPEVSQLYQQRIQRDIGDEIPEDWFTE